MIVHLYVALGCLIIIHTYHTTHTPFFRFSLSVRVSSRLLHRSIDPRQLMIIAAVVAADWVV